jgi:hypothetical protein
MMLDHRPVRLTKDVLVQAAISFDPVKSSMARQLLKQRKCLDAYRARNPDKYAAYERKRQAERREERRAYYREYNRRTWDRTYALRKARRLHLELGRPLMEIYREMGIAVTRNFKPCDCKQCRKEAA